MTDKHDNRFTLDKAFAETLDTVSRTLLNAPGPVREITKHLASSMGKGVRARLLLASAMDSGGFVSRDAVDAGTAIELLHMATLVHDDIIDEAVLRRNIQTAHSKFGKEKAVLCGDWLLCAALRFAVDIETTVFDKDRPRQKNTVSELVRAAEKVCVGELDERAHVGDLDLSPRRYLSIIDGKTAALFCLSARIGAVIGGYGDRELNLMVKFARYYGYAFQISDDVRDYSMNESNAKKTVKNDLVSGVITLPVILGFMRDSALKRLAADVILGDYGIGPFIDRLRKSNGVEDAAAVCQAYAKKANSILKDPFFDSRRKVFSELLGVLDTFADINKKDINDKETNYETYDGN